MYLSTLPKLLTFVTNHKNSTKMNISKRVCPLLALVLFCLPIVVNGQGWERIFPGAYQSFGLQVFVEADSNYLLNVRIDSDARLMTVNQQGYELSSVNIPGSLLTENMIQTADGQLASAANLSTSSPADTNDVRISKFDRNGNVLWQYDFGSDQQNQRVTALAQGTNGHYAFAGGIGNPSTTTGYVAALDENGNELWHTGLFGSFEIYDYRLCATPDGGYFVAGSYHSFDNSFYMGKLDQNGNVEWNSQTYQGYYVRDVLTAADGNIVMIGEDDDFTRLIKLDASNGSEIWSQEWPSSYVTSLIQTSDGGYAYLYIDYENNGGSRIGLVKTDANGNEQWQQFYASFPGNNTGRDIKETPDGGYIIIGSTSGESINPEYTETYLIKTDENGYAFISSIEGYVRYDLDEDCDAAGNEPALEDWIVTAMGTDRNYYGSVDEDGFYYISVDTGSYEVSVYPPTAFWNPCDNMIPVLLPQIGDTLSLDFPVQSLGSCPLMEVNTSSSGYRLCNPATLKVRYCNHGTLIADNVTVEVMFDEALEVQGASVPIISQIGNTYTFEIGAVEFLECGTFTVDLQVSCDIDLLGQSLCTEAHIYPDTTCLPVDPQWSGASIQADAYCEDGTVKLKLENVGSGNMQSQLEYLVVEDDVIMMAEPYQLVSGDSIVLDMPASGAFYRIQSPQVPFHPGSSMPSAQVEACISGSSQEVSTGFVNQYPLNDNDLFIDILCHDAVAAYDPNQKEARPAGYQQQHYIDANTRLEYTLQFQNTGTDTARKVVLQDMLSSSLNPATFRKGASSHDYEVRMSPDGVLTFTFDNIMLPDSNANQAASQGFVSFQIDQQPNLPVGTVIENEASIFFDFNPPIITNTTFHTIGENFNLVDVGEILIPEASVKVFPNPFRHSATIEIEGWQNRIATFQLYDAAGRIVRRATFDGHQYQLRRNGLNRGIYFYTISCDDQMINRGKIIVD